MSYHDISPDTLRADLEALYASVEEGWACLKPVRRTHGDPFHGCVYQQMNTVVSQQLLKFYSPTQPEFWHELHDRCDAMVAALGFVQDGGLRKSKLFVWNDHEATWDSMRERIKDAIGKL